MSVYIEGMAMPEDGRYILCITHDSSWNVHWVFQNEDTYEFLKHGRVKELSPHGRLIDADALKEHFPHDEDWDYPVNTNSLVCETIDNAPTIIEAEEEKV